MSRRCGMALTTPPLEQGTRSQAGRVGETWTGGFTVPTAPCGTPLTFLCLRRRAFKSAANLFAAKQMETAPRTTECFISIAPTKARSSCVKRSQFRTCQDAQVSPVQHPACPPSGVVSDLHSPVHRINGADAAGHAFRNIGKRHIRPAQQPNNPADLEIQKEMALPAHQKIS